MCKVSSSILDYFTNVLCFSAAHELEQLIHNSQIAPPRIHFLNSFICWKKPFRENNLRDSAVFPINQLGLMFCSFLFNSDLSDLNFTCSSRFLPLTFTLQFHLQFFVIMPHTRDLRVERAQSVFALTIKLAVVSVTELKNLKYEFYIF